MIAAASLGVRLSLAGGWRRPTFMALASAVGAYLLVGAAELPGAILLPGAGGQERAVSLGTILAVVVVPATLLLLAVNRLSASLRDTRLARLRMLGLSSMRVRLVASGENVAFGAVGAIVGAVAYAATAPAASRWLIDRGLPLLTALPARPADLAGVVAGVVLLSGAVAMAPHRTIQGTGLTTRVEGTRPMPSPWRLVPILVGLVLTAFVLTRDLAPETAVTGRVIAAFLVGTVLTGVGIVFALAPLIAWSVALLSRFPLPVPALLAVRRQQAEPTSVVRLLTGLVLATFLTAFAMGPVAAFEGTAQYAAARQIAEQGPRQMIVFGPGVGSDESARELSSLPGVLAVWRSGQGSVPSCDGAAQPGPCPTPVIAECPSIVAILGPGTCSSTGPTLVQLDDGTATIRSVRLDTTAGSRTITARSERVGATVAVTWQAGLPLLVLPPHVAREVGVDPGDSQSQVWSSADTRVDQPLADWVRARGGSTADGWQSDYAELERIRFLVRLVGSVIVGLGLLIVLISAVDRVIERRRVVASLVAIGTPRRTLVLAQLTQAAVGIIPAVGVAVVCGMACATAYLHLVQVDETFTPWSSWSVVAAVALGGSVVVALATSAGVGASMRPENLRRE